MRAILYYVEAPQPFELHGLQRLVYEDLTVTEARMLMQIPEVREPGRAHGHAGVPGAHVQPA